MLRTLAIALFILVLFIGLSVAALEVIYGGGESFPDRSSDPQRPASALEVVADLDYPPGNIAVSADNDIFFTFHPEGRPPYNLAELVEGKAAPLRFNNPDNITVQTVLSLRIDQQNRLWLLDYADHGQGQAQILAIDLSTRDIVHHYQFSSAVAGLGSHLNDFQVDANGEHIYIADASILGLTPAIIHYDTVKRTARRLFEDHESVMPDHFVPVVGEQKMLMFGVFAIRPGVDSIALDRHGEWLYFAPVTDEHLHRVRVKDIHDPTLTTTQIAQRVERFAKKTMSDGITTDDSGRIYLSDLEHSAITVLSPTGELSTLVKDAKLRWPDGFSFGPQGTLYVSASSLQHVIAKPASYIAQHGPYQLFKIETGFSATPGH